MYLHSKDHIKRFTSLALLFFTPALAISGGCPSFCRFRLCAANLRDGLTLHKENRLFSLGVPNSPLGPFPCIKRENGPRPLRNVTSGEARVAAPFSGDRFIPISKYKGSEDSPRFPRRFLRWVLNPETGQSSIQRMRFARNQDKDLDGMCVQMPVTSFVREKWDGSRRRVRTRGKSACVGFKVIVPKLIIRFDWSSLNDFDLRLREPNGFEINRFGPNVESPNGGSLVKDNGHTTCQILLGKETIIYLERDIVESGEYEISVDHNRVCEAFTKYTLRVLYQESFIFEDSGIIRQESGEGVIKRKFTIP